MLSVHSLYFNRQAQNLFQNLNFSLNPGEILQINGTNGSGKSTLLRVLASFLKPSSGDIFYQQSSIYDNEDEYRTNLAYLGHSNAIKPALSLQENLIAYCQLMGVKVSLNVNQVLNAFQLLNSQTKLAYQLSAGQQRKLALTKIILSQKPVWILDEPLTALDQSSIEVFSDYLEQHLAEGRIAIIATHQKLQLPTHSIQFLTL